MSSTTTLVSGLMPPAVSDPTLYDVLTQTKTLSAQLNQLTTESKQLLADIKAELLLPIPPLSKSIKQTSNSIAQALYTLQGEPLTFVPISENLRVGLLDYNGDPYMHALNQAMDVTVAKISDIQSTLDVQLSEIVRLMQSSGSSAIVDKLTEVITLLTTITTKLDIPSSTISNNVQLTTARLDTLIALCNDVFYQPIPYSDATSRDYINCEKNKINLIQLLFRALYLPQKVFTYPPDRSDYSFVPYLSALAMMDKEGTGDNQFAPQVNKSDPFTAGLNWELALTTDDIFSRLFDPTISKPLQPVVKPTRVLKRKGT